MKPQIEVGLNAVIVAVTEEIPRILSLHVEDEQRLPLAALPYGPLDVGRDSTLELGLRRWVEEQTGIRPGYAEQLYTFGDRNRDPGDARLLSVAYLALVREQTPPVAVARWSNWYAFLPWEDWREGRPGILDRDILPALGRWMDSSPQDRMLRRERIEVCFGWGGAPWNWERVLERYELLFEAKLVPESWRRQSTDRPSGVPRLGRPMFLDHRRILANFPGSTARKAEVPTGRLRASPSRVHTPPASETGRGPGRPSTSQAELPAPRGSEPDS